MRNAECVELVLTTMKPVWLTMFVCEHLLEFYDESLLPLLGEYDDKYVLSTIIMIIITELPIEKY